MSTTTTAHPVRHGRIGGFGHFVLHFFEMCMPMCIGWAVGDVIYFAVADPLGSSEPFRDWPELSLAIVTFNMTAPMVAWMRFRGIAWRPTAEMAAGMVVLALLILAAGWLGIAAMQTLPWLAHGLMMPAMLVPMLLRVELYTGHARGGPRMSASATRHPTVRTPSGLFAYASFAIMVGGWVAFAVALVASQPTLDDIWTSVRDLPLVIEGVVWLLGFPFLIGLAIWQASWDEAVRVTVIAVLAVAYTYMFVPRVRKR